MKKEPYNLETVDDVNTRMLKLCDECVHKYIMCGAIPKINSQNKLVCFKFKKDD